MTPKAKVVKKDGSLSFGITFGVVGGLLIILAGIAVIIYGGSVLSITSGTFGVSSRIIGTTDTGLFLPMGLFGVLTGVIVIISSIALQYTKKNRIFWSTLVLFFAVLSLTNAAGGFMIGFFMALFCAMVGLSRG